MSDKNDVANLLAQFHYQYEPVTKVFRARGRAESEDDANEPVKLLEVNEDTIPAGIMPLGFAPHPEQGIDCPSVIIEVTPEEHEEIEAGRLELPEGWELRELLPRLPETVTTDE